MANTSAIYVRIDTNLKDSEESILSQIDAELQKGVDSIKEGKVYSADEVDAILENEFGI